MIPHEDASIYSLVKKEQQHLKEKMFAGKGLSEVEAAWLRDSRGAHKFHVDAAKRDDASRTNGHTCQLRLLAKTKQEETSSCDHARQYTLGFFRKVWAEPGRCLEPQFMTARSIIRLALEHN